MSNRRQFVSSAGSAVFGTLMAGCMGSQDESKTTATEQRTTRSQTTSSTDTPTDTPTETTEQGTGRIEFVDVSKDYNKAEMTVRNNSEARLLFAQLQTGINDIAVYNLPAGKTRTLTWEIGTDASVGEFNRVLPPLFETAEIDDSYDVRYVPESVEVTEPGTYQEIAGKFPLPKDIRGNVSDASLRSATVTKIENGTVHFKRDEATVAPFPHFYPLQFKWSGATESGEFEVGPPQKRGVVKGDLQIDSVSIDKERNSVQKVSGRIPEFGRSLLKPTVTVHAIPSRSVSFTPNIGSTEPYFVNQTFEKRIEYDGTAMIESKRVNSGESFSFDLNWEIPTPIPEDMKLSVMLHELKVPMTYTDTRNLRNIYNNS